MRTQRDPIQPQLELLDPFVELGARETGDFDISLFGIEPQTAFRCASLIGRPARCRSAWRQPDHYSRSDDPTASVTLFGAVFH